MIGGPIGRRLIEKHKLLDTVVQEDDSLLVEEEIKHERHASMYPSAVFQLIIAIGIGTVVSKLLSLTGMTFPIYIGAMIAAACMRNIGEYTGKITIYMGEINDIGGISLSLFLGIAMITLKLWQLAELALPLLILLGVMAYKLVEVYGDLSAAKEQEARLRTQVEQKEEENNSLKDALSHADDPDYILGLARDRLGLAEDGERIFPDVNN